MRFPLSQAALLAVAIVVMADPVPTSTSRATAAANAVASNVPILSAGNPLVGTHLPYAPCPKPGLNKDDDENFIPHDDADLFYTGDNDGQVEIHHFMKYPTIVLEQIASIIKVDCTADSVTMTFNNSAAFDRAKGAWWVDSPRG